MADNTRKTLGMAEEEEPGDDVNADLSLELHHIRSPFGPVVGPDGVQFRLWAPAANRVDLAVPEGDQNRFHPMEPIGGGNFQVTLADAGPGTLYRFRIDGDSILVPDPASRFQPHDVLGPSQVTDPASYRWEHTAWRGRPWHETVLYELHVGTFSPEGTFDGVRSRMERLRRLGVTAVELMPLSDFCGRRNWGYDGALPFAPDSAYGTPDDLKRLVDTAHGLGMSVFLDVVYNHFGPEGNFLHRYAPDFFTQTFQTPWGDAIDFSVSRVREFFITNALYWLEEFRFDGLRLDAVHAIRDDCSPDILEELAGAVAAAMPNDRLVHLVLENDDNRSHYLERDKKGRPLYYRAQWNDDFHHVCHVLATGEEQGYYKDFRGNTLDLLGRCLAQGFAYQGEPSLHRGGRNRGEPSKDLPPEAFVSFLQNHDQIGNRAFGDRLTQLAPPERRRALAEVLLLSPHIPMLFMGEEWATERPFLFFCDFAGELADQVREGRRQEFSSFPQFADPASRVYIPDPNHPGTAGRCTLRWEEPDRQPFSRWLETHRRLLELRRDHVVPLIPDIEPGAARWQVSPEDVLTVVWPLRDGRGLLMAFNAGAEKARVDWQRLAGTRSLALFSPPPPEVGLDKDGLLELPSWGVAWGVVSGPAG